MQTTGRRADHQKNSSAICTASSASSSWELKTCSTSAQAAEAVLLGSGRASEDEACPLSACSAVGSNNSLSICAQSPSQSACGSLALLWGCCSGRGEASLSATTRNRGPPEIPAPGPRPCSPCRKDAKGAPEVPRTPSARELASGTCTGGGCGGCGCCDWLPLELLAALPPAFFRTAFSIGNCTAAE